MPVDEPVTIGCADQADITVRHESIEPIHVVLTAKANGSVLIQDRSYGATQIRGVTVHRARVRPPAELLIGRVTANLQAENTSFDRVAAAAGAAVAAKHHAQPNADFNALMAKELRRAPWVTTSLLFHLLLLLLIFFIWPEQLPTKRATVSVVFQAPTPLAEPTVAPVVEATPEEPEDPAPEPIAPEEERELAPPETAASEESVEPSISGPASAAWATPVAVKGLGGDGNHQSRGNPEFHEHLEALRSRGLEIVFVFDSTGSMGTVLRATKHHILRMVAVLDVLVPGTRIGVVTYRDHGTDEAYLTRQVPLDTADYRMLNFMQTIEAGGGGDPPEAVLDGLQAAVNMQWTSGSERVIVLIGDAPPRAGTLARIRNISRRFAKNGNARIHAINTTRSDHIRVSVADALRSIASAGSGEYQMLEAEDTILRQVLSLAFGRVFRANLDDVYAKVSERGRRIPTPVLDAVRRADLTWLRQKLRAGDQLEEITRASVLAPNRKVVSMLVSLIGNRRTPQRAKHAIAWALVQLFDLSAPPVDPDSGEVDSSALRFLRERARGFQPR